MQKLGNYTNADALEPAVGMIELAKQKGLYQNYFTQYFTYPSGLEHSE